MSHISRELQTETMKYHYPSIRMVTIDDADDTECWGDVEQPELSFAAGGNMQNSTATSEDSLAFSYKIKYTLTI